MDFYEHVKILLKQRGTTMKEVAEKMDINLGSYRVNQNRKMSPRLDLMVKIAKYLGVSLDFLATGDEFKNAPDYPHWHELDNQHREAITMIVAMKPHTERFEDLFFEIKGAYRREIKSNARNQDIS